MQATSHNAEGRLTMAFYGDAIPPISANCNPELDLVSFLVDTEWMDPLPPPIDITPSTKSSTSDFTTHHHRLVTTGNGSPPPQPTAVLQHVEPWVPKLEPLDVFDAPVTCHAAVKKQRSRQPLQDLGLGTCGAAQSSCCMAGAMGTVPVLEPPSLSRGGSRRRSSKAEPVQGAAPTAQMRTLEQQIEAYQEQLSELMRINLQLKEREILMEEMCAFRTTQEAYFRNGGNPPVRGSSDGCCGPPASESVLSPSSVDAGLLGRGNMDMHLERVFVCPQADVPLGDPLLLGTRQAAETMATLPFADLGVVYARMVHQLSLLLVQSETNVCARTQLQQAMFNLHFFFQRMATQSEDGCHWFGRRLDDPLNESLIPEAKARCMLKSLKLQPKQVERMVDLLAIIEPRLAALDKERKELTLRLQSFHYTPPASPAAATSSGSSGDTSSGGTGSGAMGGTASGTTGRTAGDEKTAEVEDDVAARILSLGLYHGHDGEDMVGRLHRSGVSTKDFVGLLAGFTCMKIMSAEQTARFLVHSYPWMPDVPALVHLATQHSSESQELPVLADCLSFGSKTSDKSLF